MVLEKNSYIAICPREFQGIVASELLSLGAVDVEEQFKAVFFNADLACAYRIHLKLGTASRIVRILRKGHAKTFKSLYFQATKVKWSKVIPEGATFKVEAIAGDRGDDAPTSNQISKSVREAIEEHFRFHRLEAPKVELKDPQVTVVSYYHNQKLVISVDTSGKSLHKRGYKVDYHPAPVKEHIASAILRYAGYDGSQVLWDPMCGSGTFPIEASYIALHKAPLIHRKKGEFGLELLADFNKDLWKETQDCIRNERLEATPAPVFASDYSTNYTEMTRKHALKARVEKYLTIESQDFFATTPKAPNGILVMNLPYGERLQSPSANSLDEFYERIGQHLKHQFMGWKAILLVSEKAPWQKIGLKPSKKLKIENGGIPCRLMIFELYSGSQKSKSKDATIH